MPRGFQYYAELAISECYSVLGHLAEDTLGTLAVVSAVMQFIRERNAAFCINNAPLGLDMTWAGSLPYFISQQELMLDLAKTCPEKSAHVGEKLLKQRYRRIDFFHELDDRKNPPALYERIHEILIKNGGKLWRRQEDPPRNNTQTRFPVLELLVTSTPRLQWGVFGAADEIEYLIERILSEDSSFGWDLNELSYLIRMAILAGNPTAVSILIWSQRESVKPIDWPGLFERCITNLEEYWPDIHLLRLDTACWRAVSTMIECLPISSVPKAAILVLNPSTHPLIIFHLYLRLESHIKQQRIVILHMLRCYFRALSQHQTKGYRNAFARTRKTSVIVLNGEGRRRKKTVVKRRPKC